MIAILSLLVGLKKVLSSNFQEVWKVFMTILYIYFKGYLCYKTIFCNKVALDV